MKRASIAIAVFFFLAITLLAAVGFTAPWEFVLYMLDGWALFLVRVVPQVSLNVPDTLLALGALALFTFGVHRFASWLYRSMATSDDGPERAPAMATAPRRSAWRVGWTFSVVAIVVVMFVAGISMVGAVHNVVWLVRDGNASLEESRSVRRGLSTNNLKHMGLAAHMRLERTEHFPAGCTTDRLGRPLHGWQTQLLPYLEQEALYDAIVLDKPWDDAAQGDLFRTRVREFENPLFARRQPHDPQTPAPSHYASNVLVIGGDRKLKMADFADGAANTILAGEVAEEFRPWGHPRNWRDPRAGFDDARRGFGAVWNPGGTQFVMADGSVRFLPSTTDRRVLEALATPAGNEMVETD